MPYTFPLTQPVAIFLVVLAIILIIPLIFSRLKIPYVVGIIVAGMAVGPHGFNILSRDASFEIFGEVGILYLMFLAGVEIDMYHLRQNSRRGFVFGLLSFAIPLGLGLLTSSLILGTSLSTSMLIGSMYASHTLISYPIVSRFGLNNTKPAVISVCGTIVAVLLALLILAGVVDAHTLQRVDALRLGRLIVLTAVYAAVLGLGVPWLSKRFFRKVSDPLTQFIYILSMVFVFSLLANLIGLEAILGAFYAGLVLNRFVPPRSSLMTRIEFAGNAIFIPYFLIGVGMLINIRVIFEGWHTLMIAGVMTLTALSGKWLAAFAAQGLFGMDGTSRKIMFGLTAGKAAATIAATMIGFRYGLLNEEIMNGAVLMILVCCTVASVVTEQSAKRLTIHMAERELEQEKCNMPSGARQLVAVANPITTEGLMRLALLMRPLHGKCTTTALFVRNDESAGRTDTGRVALTAAVKAAAAADVKVESLERYDINIVSGLVNVLKERECTEVMMGLHRRQNIVDTFYGSMTEHLLGATNRMILMTRVYIPANTLNRIIVLVPPKAEYETGFPQWIDRIANLGAELGSEVVFMTFAATQKHIRREIGRLSRDFHHRYRTLESWDDFIRLSAHIHDDDLLAVIAARRTSVSYSSELESLPGFLDRYFSRQNLLIIYPEQFGEATVTADSGDAISQEIQSAPVASPFSSGRWRKVAARLLRRHTGISGDDDEL